MRFRAVVKGSGPWHVIVLNKKGNEVDILLRTENHEVAKAAADQYNGSALGANTSSAHTQR